MKRKKILWILSFMIIVTSFTACQKKEEVSSGDPISISSGETEEVEKRETYNNGGTFVSYKGNVYYREYTNASVEATAVGTDFAYETEKRVPKYVNVILANGKIENLFQDDGYGNFYLLDDRFFFAGYSKLYSVNMQGEDYREIATGNYIWCDEENHEIYYINTRNNDTLYKINTQNLKITKLMNEEAEEIEKKIMELEKPIELSIQYQNSLEGYVFSDTSQLKPVVFTKEEIEAFQNKYNILKEDSITISHVEKVDSKIYFQIEGAKLKTGQDVNEQNKYERIASEIYEYDLETGKKKLIYLYKITDKREEESGEIYPSGEKQIEEEPLAENEMYLEINLEGKGLKDTFEVRVEEVGGLIIGKRVEYEGIHSRNEKVLKIKITKEIGAMLTVYIDNQIDSQMLIEE